MKQPAELQIVNKKN